jgi:hypothetical protein
VSRASGHRCDGHLVVALVQEERIDEVLRPERGLATRIANRG